ncbi:MAG: hypothetical protein AAFX93_05190 [Verrucomicrobiota bacterium]
MQPAKHSLVRLCFGYVLIALSTTLWLIAPWPWWIPGLDILTRALAGLSLIASAELSFYLGLWVLGPGEAEHFYRWARFKRGFRRLMDYLALKW